MVFALLRDPRGHVASGCSGMLQSAGGDRHGHPGRVPRPADRRRFGPAADRADRDAGRADGRVQVVGAAGGAGFQPVMGQAGWKTRSARWDMPCARPHQHQLARRTINLGGPRRSLSGALTRERLPSLVKRRRRCGGVGRQGRGAGELQAPPRPRVSGASVPTGRDPGRPHWDCGVITLSDPSRVRSTGAVDRVVDRQASKTP
jgi:hypothetical protein